MSSTRLLIVDDDAAFTAMYRELLEADGHVAQVASTAEQARQACKDAGPALDVILLDQKLQGPGGSDSGLELISVAKELAPLAKLIVVTGYASADAIERAFRLGVYDYLVKNGAFEALLRAKVRNAAEVAFERRRNSLRDDAALSQELQATWREATSTSDRFRKGALLERVMKLLFTATPGFAEVTTNLRTDTEELDVVVCNRSEDPLWKKEGQYLLGECKNWSKKAGSPEARDFVCKLVTKHRRATVGFYFSLEGFTDAFALELSKHATEQPVVLRFDRADIERWIAATDKLAFLREQHRRAVLTQP